MPGVIPKFQHGGPITYTAAERVTGGQIVEARTGGKIGVAGALSLKALGVATRDGKPPASPYSQNVDGFPSMDISGIGEFVAVGKHGEWPVTYAAAAGFGDKLVCAANGQVTPAAAGVDARAIVGQCTEPNGVAAGAVGLTKIGL